MISEQSYMSARKWSLKVKAVGHPFNLEVGGLKVVPRVPDLEHVTPFNPAIFQWHVGGTPIPLRAHKSNRFGTGK
jgi:hypothetical protein